MGSRISWSISVRYNKWYYWRHEDCTKNKWEKLKIVNLNTSVTQGFYQELMKNLNTSRSIEFCRSRIFKCVFQPMAMMIWTCRVSFTKLLGDIKCLFPSHHNTHTQLEDLYTYCKAIAFLYILEFCDQMLHFLQVYWRILHPTTSFKLLGVCHILGFMQREEISTKSRSIGDWRKDSTIG